MHVIKPPLPWPEGVTLVTYGADQPEYTPLPALRFHDECITVRSCWKFSVRDRIKILFSGKVYLDLLTFGKPIQPQLLHHGEVNRSND
jgi:hypothetical protein